MICADAIATGWMGCSDDHTLCDECLRAHALNELENPRWDGEIRCPCREAARQDLPPAIRQLVDDRTGAAPSHSAAPTDPVHHVVENALTHRCPHCHAAFCDFTGCAAVLCRCGGHFCACCLAPFPTNQSCHDHVRTCPFNHKRDYWIDTPTLHQIMHDHRCARAWKAIGKIAHETGSIAYAYGVTMRIAQIDAAALLPYYMRSLLCIPSLFWWVLLCLNYPFEACIGGAIFYTVQYCASTSCN